MGHTASNAVTYQRLNLIAAITCQSVQCVACVDKATRARKVVLWWLASSTRRGLFALLKLLSQAQQVLCELVEVNALIATIYVHRCIARVHVGGNGNLCSMRLRDVRGLKDTLPCSSVAQRAAAQTLKDFISRHVREYNSAKHTCTIDESLIVFVEDLEELLPLFHLCSLCFVLLIHHKGWGGCPPQLEIGPSD
jgi:hypothetical protein